MLLFAPKVWTATSVSTDSVSAHQSVGLVLSGGGAKGIAHIGVIKALEDNNIPIDYVTGTSMGAIVGGLYASGYTPEEMLDLLLSRGFSYWSTGRIDERLVYNFAKGEPTPSMVSLPLSTRRDSTIVKSPASLISPLPMNFAFMDLFAPYTAQCNGNFDNLFVPFRCVASDVKNKHKVVMSSGQLGDAIRASMSFPVVFQPIEIDSVLLYDGGIYDNFPVDVMRSEFAPDIMIGVDVHGTTDPANARDLVNQIEEMVIQNNYYDLPSDEGVKIRINLDRFSLLDFQAAKQIYQIGYDHAMAMIDSIKERVESRIPASTRELHRRVFKSATPYLRFDGVTVEGGTQAENRYIDYLFTKNRHDTIDVRSARLSYYHAISSGKLKDLFPTAVYNDTTGLFNLNLKANVRNNLSVGVGGYLTSSTNSMIFLSGRYTSMSLKTMDASLDGWVGQSYMAAALNTRLVLPSHTPTALALQGVISSRKYYESDKLFFDAASPTFITRVEAFGRVRYLIAAGRSSVITVDAGGGTMMNRFYRADAMNHDGAKRDVTRNNIGQAPVSFYTTTLENLTAPTKGFYSDITGSYNTGRYHYRSGIERNVERASHVDWFEAHVLVKGYKRLSRRFSLGGELDALYSNRLLLDNYNATIVNAPAFTPTPASDNSFNPAFRANSYIALGAVPVWIINDNMQLRGNFHLFQPVKRIMLDGRNSNAYYGSAFSRRYAYCEISAAYTLPFATINLYGNYLSYPAHNWNVGISFGLYFLAPKL